MKRLPRPIFDILWHLDVTPSEKLHADARAVRKCITLGYIKIHPRLRMTSAGYDALHASPRYQLLVDDLER